MDRLDMSELQKALKDSKNKKAAGHDGITVELLKYASSDVKQRRLH